MNSNILNNLSCPITMELLENPITVPCCGKAFSRLPLIQYLNSSSSKDCPTCRGDLSNFDAENAQKNVILESLVEEYTKLNNIPVPPVDNSSKELGLPEWKANINQLTDNDDDDLEVGELKLSLNYSGFSPKPCLFLVVVDRSGSMSGKPFQQVQSALLHIVRNTHSNPNIRTVIVAYDNIAEIINTNGSLSEVEFRVKALSSGGGTSFPSAFSKIKDVLKDYEYKDDSISQKNVSNVVITFMTDGEDGSGRTVESLTNSFQEQIQSSWNGPYSVHTVGFGKNHNFNLLEKMRKIGTCEGFYRYSDYDDEGDALCNKLTAIFDVVSSSSTVPITLQMPLNHAFYSRDLDVYVDQLQFPINEDGKGSITRWIKVPKNRDHDTVEIKITSKLNNQSLEKIEFINVSLQYVAPELKKSLYSKWIIKLIEELAAEVLELSSKDKKEYGPNVYELHCALMQQRGQAISKYIGTDEASQVVKIRLDNILKEIEAIQSGAKANQARLNDLRFDSQFNVTNSNNNTTNNSHNNINNNSVPKKKIGTYRSNNGYSKIKFNKGGYRNWNRIHQSIIRDPKVNLASVLANASNNEICYKDRDGNTPLMWASYIGNVNGVKSLLSKCNSDEYINDTNNYNHTCLELALNQGQWLTATYLIEAGAKVDLNTGKKLLQFALERSYFQTASLILGAGFAELDDDMNNNFPEETIQWLLSNSKVTSDTSDKYINLAISKGMVDLAEKLIKEKVPLNNKMLYDCCVANSPNHIRIAELMLQNGLDPNGGVSNQGGSETPLFIASQKGILEFVKLLLKYGADYDRTNANGNTPLWIACCNNYLDIAIELLNAGADPNRKNDKGNSSLIPACQRGADDIVLMLLSRGAEIEYENNNGDTPVIISCRTGQAKVLELLLGQCSNEAIIHKAKIDGFNALFAATESDRATCIKILVEHGANMEEKTEDSNAILPGATPLHLACYYNRFNAAKELLTLGANPNSKDFNGSTPLHLAVKQGYPKLVQLLRSFKANTSIKDNNGYMPAFYCKNNNELRNELVDCVASLLVKLARRGFLETEEANANNILRKYSGSLGCLRTSDSVDVLSSEGNTPLIEAVIHSNIPLIKTLIHLGANPYYQDSKGLNAVVWAQWINNKEIKQLFPLNIENNAIMTQPLLRLQTVSKQDVKNAMVLFLCGKPPSNIIADPYLETNILEKMNGFIEFTNSVKMIEFKDSNTSIVKFFDKFTDNRLDKQQQSAIQTLIWNAKIFITGVIASGQTEMQPQHILAIYMYTTNTPLWKFVNESILTPNNYFVPYIQCLYEALSFLPDYTGTVYRGVSTKFDRRLYSKGNMVNWQPFSIGSLEWSNCADFNKKSFGTVFIIKAKRGKIIKQYSQFPQNSEVLFLPNSKFKVTNWYVGSVIALGQENIRESAFKIKDEDISKYENSNENLLIELTEL